MKHDKLTTSPNAKTKAAWVVMLQQVPAQLFSRLVANPTLRESFLYSPSCWEEWPTNASTGNITLISNTLYFSQVIRVNFHNSRVGRHAVVMDLILSQATSRRLSLLPSKDGTNHPSKPLATPPKESTTKCVRIINASLEPLAFGRDVREHQLSILSKCVKDPGVYAAISGQVGDTILSSPTRRRKDDASENGTSDSSEKLSGKEYTTGVSASGPLTIANALNIKAVPTLDTDTRVLEYLGRGWMYSVEVL
jgi:hypothetical protein